MKPMSKPYDIDKPRKANSAESRAQKKDTETRARRRIRRTENEKIKRLVSFVPPGELLGEMDDGA